MLNRIPNKIKEDWILVVDDDDELTDILSLTLESEGYLVKICQNLRNALELLSRLDFSLILLDMKLSDGNGLDLLPQIREANPNVPVIVITAHGDVESAVTAFTLGASGYVRKPFKEGDLKAQVAQVIEDYRIREEVKFIQNLSENDEIRSIIRSRDPAMEPVLRQVAIAAGVMSNVVISGESGTGKELVARALHRCGPRRNGPFVAFNCAALPENLIESELFGYVRGAFTDAREAKSGLFVRAHGGTLFVDEIGDAPPAIQAKLLRVLQEREVLPLGASAPVRVDVRVITATHKTLKEEVAGGKFRQDLFYRLHVIPIHVPSLRDRPKDIVFLGFLFAARIATEMGLEFEGFTQMAIRVLQEHEWGGNVRELQNRIEHALVLGRGGILSARILFPEKSLSERLPEDQQAWVDPEKGNQLPSFKAARDSFERSYLERILTAARGNIAKASRLAEKSRTEVYGLLRKHGLKAGAFKRLTSAHGNRDSS